MKKVKSILSIVLALLLLVVAIPFGGIVATADTVTPEILKLAGGGINLAKNGDFEEGVINTSSQVTAKSKDGIERISVKESGGNKYLAIPARNNDDLNTSAGYNGYSFQQKFVGLETTKAYTLSFSFKTQNKNDWGFFVGLYDNVAKLGTNPSIDGWQYIEPISSKTSGGVAYEERSNGIGAKIGSISTTDWVTVKIVFTPKNVWTSLVIHPQSADIGELCLDDIVLTANDGYTVFNGDFENTLGDGSFDFVGGITSNANGATNKPQVVDSSICGGNGSYSLYVPSYSYYLQEVPNLVVGNTYKYSYNVRLQETADNSWKLFSLLKSTNPGTNGNYYDGTDIAVSEINTSSGLSITKSTNLTIINKATKEQWYTVTETFTATTTNAYIYILGWFGVDSYFDDFSLVEVSANNHVVNGDFEDANFNGFTTNNAKLVTAQSVGANGKYALYLPHDGTNKSQAWQMVTGLTVGKEYNLTYKVRFATLATGWTLFADIYDYRPQKLTNPTRKTNITRSAYNINDGFVIEDQSSYGLIASSGKSYSTKWQSIIIPFTANATTAYINFFHFSNNVPDIYIDDIAVVENNGVYITNGDFSKGTADYAVSDNTACVVSNYDDTHGNVVTIPKSAKDTPTARKLSKVIVGLTVGETYSVTFDLKLDNYETPTEEWLAIAGVSTVKPHLNGNDQYYYNVKQPTESGFLCDSYSGTFRKDASKTIGYIQYNGSTEWMTYEANFVAESETVYFYIENNYAKADLVLDNISIDEYDIGDAIEDQKIDLRDLVAVGKYANKLPTNIKCAAGDLDFSDIINDKDIDLLRTMILNK